MSHADTIAVSFHCGARVRGDVFVSKTVRVPAFTLMKNLGVTILEWSDGEDLWRREKPDAVPTRIY